MTVRFQITIDRDDAACTAPYSSTAPACELEPLTHDPEGSEFRGT